MEGQNLMKHQLLLGAILFSLSGSLMAAESLCQQKEHDIQREIDMAKPAPCDRAGARAD